MMAKTISSTLTLLAVFAFSGAQAQTINEERVKIDQHQVEISSLQHANADLEKQLSQLDKKIAGMASNYAPEEKARNQAEARYRKAQKAAENTPSSINKERAETARFEYLMKDRQYQRSSQDVTKLKKQHQALQGQLASNKTAIGNTNQKIKQQRKLIVDMEQSARKQATQQANSERQLRIKKEDALRSSRNELTKTREQHAAAMAEIALLKAMLAEKEVAASVANVALPTSIAATTLQASLASNPAVASDAIRTPASNSKAIKTETAESTIDSLFGDKKQYLAMLGVAQQQRGARSRTNKILHVKTFKNSRMNKQTSHSLRYIGNGVYRGKTVVRAGETAFVIGSKKWRSEIPGHDNKTQYIFLLDTRDKSSPELKLFPRSEVQ